MISWSTKRQFFYISSAIIVILFALALPVLFVTYKAPSCTDGVKNQGEFGVDCGGPCNILCKVNALDLITRWQRAFKVKDGFYSALAYVENPNYDSEVEKISYRFKLYDTENVLISEREGQTFVPPGKIFGIFESNIPTGTRIPARTFFEFTTSPVWKKNGNPKSSLTAITDVLPEVGPSPRLTGFLKNSSLFPIYNVEVVAIVYNASDNAIGASRTIVDMVGKDSSVPLTFTWPEAFTEKSIRSELIYRMIR